MQSIPIDAVLARDVLVVDTYLCLNSDKFILIAKAGSSSEVLKKYKEKKVDRIYVQMTDYFHWMHKVLGEATQGNQTTNALAKISNLESIMINVYQEIAEIGIDENVFNHVKMINHFTMEVMAKSDPLANILMSLEKVQNGRIKNAMLVSMIASSLGTAHGWNKPGTIEKLSLGGFLHDIGMTKLPRDLVERDYSKLSKDEKTIFKSHPEAGNLMLMQIKTVPDDVRLMVWEHHEFADGSGYPKGLKDLHISPFGRIAALADYYADELAKAPALRADERHAIAYENVMRHRVLFNRDAIKAFQKIFPDKQRAAS